MRASRLLLWPAGVALGVTGEWVLYGWGDPQHWVPDLAAGWSLIACGLVSWSRRPESRAGVLMTATGFAWFAGNFAVAGPVWLAWLSGHALYLYRGPLVHLVLSYPRGRLAGRLARVAGGGGYAAAVVTPVWRSETASIVLAGCLAAVASRGYLRPVGREASERRNAWQAAIVVAFLVAGAAAVRLANPTVEAKHATLLATQLGLCAVSVGLLAGLIEASARRARMADLVVELGEGRSGSLRDALARTLGDPTLQVRYWSPQAEVYVDDAGRRLEPAPTGADRAVTRVDRDGHVVVEIVHDPAVLDDPGLLDAVAAASRLSGSNAQLQAEVRAQLSELDASRRRLLRSGDAERRRLEQRLRNGAEWRLVRLEATLELARSRVGEDSRLAERIDRVGEQLSRTLSELRELAGGLHPHALIEHGFAGALVSLTEPSPVPVELALSVERLPEEVEAALYFVCSEALANVAKYASASKVTVVLTANKTNATIEISDDGAGGADPSRGSGLLGLADRLEALGGTLRVASPRGLGTRVVAELPLSGLQ